MSTRLGNADTRRVSTNPIFVRDNGSGDAILEIEIPRKASYSW